MTWAAKQRLRLPIFFCGGYKIQLAFTILGLEYDHARGGHPMKETKSVLELCEPGIRPFPNGDEARIEKLHIWESGREEVVCSRWSDGKMLPRALDLSEGDLIVLFRDAMAKDVFTP